MKKIALLLFILITLSPAFAGDRVQKRAFTLDDLYSLKNISGLTKSYDGNLVVFSVSKADYKKGKSSSNIFLLNVITGAIKQLTRGENKNFSPEFSKSGKFLYFLSSREKGIQVWRIPLDGGEAERLTDFSMGVDNFKVIDDNTIVFSTYVFPEAGADSKKNKELQDKMDKNPVQAHYGDKLLFRHWTSYRDFKYSHLIRYNISKKKYSAITKGKADYPAFWEDFDISPDGKFLIVTVKDVPDPAESTNDDLVLIDLKNGTEKNLTKDNPAYDGNPQFSPDGRYIAYRLQKVPGYESDRFRLAVYDTKTGKKKILTEKVDNWVNSFKWANSKTIYFTVMERGYTPICSVNVESGKIKKVFEKVYVREFVPVKSGVLANISSVGKPYDIYKLSFKNKTKTRVTFFNKKIEDNVDIRPAEQVWVKGADGAKIHLFIVKPHNFDPNKKYPLILNVHGGPQYMWADSFRGDWQVYPGAGYIVAFPNPHGSTGYGQEFTKAISKDYTGKVMEDIEKVTQYLEKLPYVDKDRMGAMGWSWGGYAMMWLEGHNKHFKCLVAMMGLYDLPSWYGSTEELWFPNYDCGGAPWENPEYYKKSTPSNYVKNFKTPCLVITGERDYRVPYTQSIQFFTALQKRGVPSEIIIFKNDGHWPDPVKSMPLYYNAHLEWFNKWLKGGKAPYNSVDMIRGLAYEEKDK
ncbi:peptidase S9 prolyl oligopeptidase [Thermotomaculum hydrothermale]|uniref:Peptidase S9 prolyl oligopeptidase n=1 Tax=Thermotomaculum hydrothermale TaxID=981385 RepID=A0A7R6SZ56_9BACT|nr:S9 family peptidase [Thermotomaculum hydrothermale]BBB32475.1 peptidase S9 prolyl oligopeptidase [Thermotomaculum hydrothermale]